FQIQAAIAALHASARSKDETDWPQIAALYGALARHLPSSIVLLNRAVAVGMAEGPEAGLAALDALEADEELAQYHLLPATPRAELLVRGGRPAEAKKEFERALALVKNEREKSFLLGRLSAVG